MVYKNKTELIQTVIQKEDTVLDVGFWGQGTNYNSPHWVHTILKNTAGAVYGVDLEFDETKVFPKDHYFKGSAEQSNFRNIFDVVFAGDVIEHLPNPGLFLDSCSKMLKGDGRLIITTPNTFNLFNLAEKITKREPTVNHDHVSYYNEKTLKKLLEKCGFETVSVAYLYTLDTDFVPSWKKRVLDVLYKILSLFTDKFIETLVITARRNPSV